MDVRWLLSIFVIVTIICGGNAFKCYECHYQNITDLQLHYDIQHGQLECILDPFQSSGIALVECPGQCFANLTEVSSDTYIFEAVYRGCTTDTGNECKSLQGCQYLPGTRVCNHCCDGDACNIKSFEKIDADTSRCYHCQAELTPDGMPVDGNTCGRDGFDGSGDPVDVLVLPCPSETCITVAQSSSPNSSATITRACATDGGYLDLCNNERFYEIFAGFDIECCTGNLCNTYTPSFENPATVPMVTEDGGSRGSNQCYECYYEDVIQSGFSWSQGQPGCMDPVQFPSDGIALVDCPGQCYANKTQVSSEELTYLVVSRGCTTGLSIQCEEFQGCSKFSGTHVCNYCCDQDNCNSRSFEEVDADSFKCYNCQAELPQDGMLVDGNTCGGVDFDGTGDDVSILACPQEACMIVIESSTPEKAASITRSCATMDYGIITLCTNTEYQEFYEYFGGFDLECCHENLCNANPKTPIDANLTTVASSTKVVNKTPKPRDNKSSKILPSLILSFVSVLSSLILELI